MAAPDAVLALVARFEMQRESLRAPGYNETSIRREFIDPLFRALGWDVDNSAGHAEAYKDVVHEDAVKVGTLTKAPDYSFRIGGTRKFFVEAKKPAVNLKEDASPAYQLRRYAWSGKLPLSILTDFEEFAVYDCRGKPASDDKASAHRLLYIRYTEYATRWDEIADIFSRDAVLKGSFDKYAESKKGKRGTATVDKAFLEDIEYWRELLARNLALRNATLTQPELNFAVQRTIDRIIFLRIAEDRGLEDYGRLLALANGANAYRRLMDLFAQADARYNSGLFHFRRERDRAEAPDDLSPRLVIDDKPLQEIVEGLYYPKSPYEFSVLPADILGQVYEQFLGKVIRLTEGHRAKVEEKPEVKKAGGVYYTPTYIVDYIVKETVGRLLEGRTPKQADALRIVDPACGSGSFLIGAYQHVLDWYRDRYVEEGAAKHRKRLYQGPGGVWRLSSAERKRILLNNIFGVDIDPQAVEVTKLSLLLKVLEGESSETIQHELTAFRERALPDLGRNIKCGNSLVGSDYYAQAELGELDEADRIRVNVFDWEAEFPAVLKGTAGGFDAVIGNPPYVRMEGFKPLKAYLRAHYAVHSDRADLYAYFLERANRLARSGGWVGMIISNKFLRARYGAPLRHFLSTTTHVTRVVDFSGLPVFAGATVRTIVLITQKTAPGGGATTYIPPLAARFAALAAGRVDVNEYAGGAERSLPNRGLTDRGWSFAGSQHRDLLQKLRDAGIPLSEYAAGRIGRGIVSGLSKAFVVDEQVARRLARNLERHPILKPFLGGKDVRRYYIEDRQKYLIFAYHGVDMSAFPRIERHLSAFRIELESRATEQEWYELQQPQQAYQTWMEGSKIVFPDIAKAPRFALDSGHFVANTCYFIGGADRALLGLLNSRVAHYYFTQVCAGLEAPGETYLRFFGQYLEGFPVARDERRQQLDALTIRLERLRADSPSTLAHADVAGRRVLTAADGELDRLVYDLYGLTDAEIRIIEEATS